MRRLMKTSTRNPACRNYVGRRRNSPRQFPHNETARDLIRIKLYMPQITTPFHRVLFH